MNVAHGEWVEAACDWLKRAQSEALSDTLRSSIATATPGQLNHLHEAFLAAFEELCRYPRRVRVLFQLIASRCMDATSPVFLPPDTLVQVHNRLGEVDGQAAAHELQILSKQGFTEQGDEESIDCLARILSEAPPQDWQLVGLSLSPLWQASGELLQLFFERLQDGFMHPATMAVLLDLANYALRERILPEHPWAYRQPELVSMLRSVVVQLEKLEKSPDTFGNTVEEVQRVLGDGLALSIALCDALGQIGDQQALAALKSALELKHRRIQTEAAIALARLGEQSGKRRIVELANDPVARRRAVAYAEELDFVEEIDETLRTPLALAESELATWLASPTQFGLPPAALELIDSRTQFWPSFDDPQDCFLFRFSYELSGGMMSNIGIAGPVSHAFQADLANLPIDDIYAAFAGWQAEHEEIFEIPLPLLNAEQRREADRLLACFEDLGFEVTECLALTFFFGELALLARLSQDGKQLCAITDGVESIRFPTSTVPTTITPEVVLSIYRGRKLLRTFNP